MHASTTLALATAALAGLATAQHYHLVDNFTQENFFDNFNFINQPDPTHGLVNYVAAQAANNQRLAGFFAGGVYLGADHTKKVGPDGRPSVRVESQKTYNHGLFIGDFAHMPQGCGTWPAFWTYGIDPTWPNGGEIDVIEGVHTDEKNSMTLHTGPGCRITQEGTLESTKLVSENCNDGDAYMGCGQHANNTLGFGEGFNANGGGVYAMEWTSEHIAVWFFPRGEIPEGVLDTENPEVSNFGTPSAKFVGGEGCNIDEHFKNHVIVINLTVCGDWAGNVWGNYDTCSAKAGSCEEYVMNKPEAFTEAYWLINSVRTYQKLGEVRRMVAKPFQA